MFSSDKLVVCWTAYINARLYPETYIGYCWTHLEILSPVYYSRSARTRCIFILALMQHFKYYSIIIYLFNITPFIWPYFHIIIFLCLQLKFHKSFHQDHKYLSPLMILVHARKFKIPLILEKLASRTSILIFLFYI